MQSASVFVPHAFLSSLMRSTFTPHWRHALLVQQADCFGSTDEIHHFTHALATYSFSYSVDIHPCQQARVLNVKAVLRVAMCAVPDHGTTAASYDTTQVLQTRRKVSSHLLNDAYKDEKLRFRIFCCIHSRAQFRKG